MPDDHLALGVDTYLRANLQISCQRSFAAASSKYSWFSGRVDGNVPSACSAISKPRLRTSDHSTNIMNSAFALFFLITGQLLLTSNGVLGSCSFGVGMRNEEDQLLLKDVQHSRPADTTESANVVFKYNIKEPITYIEIASEEVSYLCRRTLDDVFFICIFPRPK